MKVICVGRNYLDHAKELNNPVPKTPLIFFKPDTSVLRSNKDFYYPEFSKDIHYECEVVLRICREGKYIQEDYVRSYIDGVGIGIDFTARDIQADCKKKGWPWTLAKGFNGAAPVSDFLAIEDFPDLQDIHFSCKINDELRQQGHTGDMIFGVKYLISYITQFITLKKGDLIFTGTPVGVGPVKINDRIAGFIGDQKMMDFHVR